MKNIYEQVAANQRKSYLIISFFIAFIVGSVYLITQAYQLGPDLLLGAIGFSFLTSFFSYFYSDKVVLGLSGAKTASRQHHFDLYTVTENLCMTAKIPQPELYVIDSPALNAFATGRSPDHAALAVTTGLLAKLNRTQLEGVVGHELAHIKNRDILVMSMVVVLIGLLAILSDILLRSSFSRSRRSDKQTPGFMAILGFLAILFAPLIANLIKLAISRRREFFADAYSARLTRYPEGLAQALEIISVDTHQLDTASTATAHLYITNPFKQKNLSTKITSLFNTHPPVADRIAALRGH